MSETDIQENVVIVAEINPAAVFLSGQSTRSRYTYKLDLNSISALLGYPDPFTCPWEHLRFQHTAAIRTALVETISDRTGKPLSFDTINRKLSVLRGVLKTAWRLGLMDAEDYYRAADIERVKGESVPAGRILNYDEIAKLMEGCASGSTLTGARDASIIALMCTCGLRRSEVVGLVLSDYDPSSGTMVVLGKRNKKRPVYLANETSQAMEDWLEIRGSWDGPLFVPFIPQRYKMIFRRLSTQTLYDMLNRRGKQAGIAKFSPHDLRRTFISNLLDAGVDINTVAKMAGHSSITTTAKYDKRGEKTKREASQLLHVPYTPRK